MLRMEGIGRMAVARLAKRLERKYQSLKRIREEATADDASGLRLVISRALPAVSRATVQRISNRLGKTPAVVATKASGRAARGPRR